MLNNANVLDACRVIRPIKTKYSITSRIQSQETFEVKKVTACQKLKSYFTASLRIETFHRSTFNRGFTKSADFCSDFFFREPIFTLRTHLGFANFFSSWTFSMPMVTTLRKQITLLFEENKSKQ